jgi:chromosome segregation ATPase
MKSDIRDCLQEAIPQNEKDELHQQLQEIQQVVLDKKAEQKQCKADVKAKRANYLSAKKSFKELRMKKTKGERPVRVEVEDILV